MKIRILRLRLPGWRTAAALSAATAIVVGAALAAPNQSSSAPAAASPVAYAASTGSRTAQGGCNEYTVGSTGFEIGVCINDRHTGTTAYPDIYLNRIGAHSGPCSISIELWDDNGHRYGTNAQASCTPGEHLGNAYGPVNSPITLHAFARLQLNGTSYYLGGNRGDSPAIALTPAGSSSSGGASGGEVCLFNAPKGAELFNGKWAFGHTDWGFLQDDGIHWTFGGTEENNGAPIMPPGNPAWTDSWHESGTRKQMLDKFRAGGGTPKGAGWYTQYRCAHTSTRNATLAMVAVHVAEYSGYNGLTDNCLTKAIMIFKAYSSDVWLYHPGTAMGPNWYFDHLPSAWGPTTAL